jgi:hypothetical protein
VADERKRFLVFTSPTEEGMKNPPPAKAFQAQIDFMKDAVADGIIEFAFHGDGHAVLIVDAETREALEKFLGAIPLSEFMQRKIEPLEDLFAQMGRVHAWLVDNDKKLGRG